MVRDRHSVTAAETGAFTDVYYDAEPGAEYLARMACHSRSGTTPVAPVDSAVLVLTQVATDQRVGAPATAGAGTTVTLSIHVTRSGSAAAGVAVQVERRLSGQTTPSAVLHATTGADGQALIKDQSARTVTYTVSTPQSVSAAASSGQVRIGVSPAFGQNFSPVMVPPSGRSVLSVRGDRRQGR